MQKLFPKYLVSSVLVFMLISTGVNAQQWTLEISEFMSANGSHNVDEFGENDDWIEIHNYGSIPLDLKGLYLSDDEMKPRKFRFDNSLILGANEYLLLWADNQIGQGVNHLDFKITESETIVLSDENSVVDIVKIENQRIDISFGKNALTTNYCYYLIPTPGSENNSECFEFLAPVDVSHTSGNYTESLAVSLSHSDGADIYYTIDGSKPNLQAEMYDNGLIDIFENTTLRTIAYKEGSLSSTVGTKTYIFNEENTIPILFATSNGNKIDGGTNANINLEYLDLNGNQIFSEDVSSRLHGKIDQLSFKVFFGSKHGGKKVKLSLFNDKPDVDEFESLIFRQAGNDDLSSSSTRRSHMRDGFLSTIVNRGDFKFKASGFQQVSVYLDGQYYGIFNMRERIDKSFVKNNYDINDEIPKCFMEYKFGEPSNINEIEGEWSYFSDVLWSKCFDSDLSDDSSFSSAIQNLNVEDFTDYWMHEIFIANFDWLTNNVYFWAPKTEEGKFRWILWDTDVSIGLNGDPDWNSLDWATSTEPGRPFDGRRTAIIRGLLTNSNYQEYFITRFCDLMNSEYNPESTIALLDELADNIVDEVPRHTERWNKGSLETWEKELDRIRIYMSERPNYVREHIKLKFPFLDELYNLNLQTSLPNAGYFEVNTIEISEQLIPWNGKYFKDLPLSLKVHANEGFRFVGWQHTTELTTNIVINPFSDTTVVALFEPITKSDFDVVINEISYAQIEKYKSDDWVELYNNTDENIDLTGWTFEDASLNNDAFVFPINVILESGEYVVLAKNKDKFETIYPNVESVVGDLDFGLSKNGDCLKLYDNEGQLVDFVNYKPDNPWPEAEANSIELIAVDLDNNIGSSWESSLNSKGSPGYKNGDESTNIEAIHLQIVPIKVFPNPAGSLIYIESMSNGHVKIFDILGKEMHSSSISGQTIILDISSYPSGSYFVSFEDFLNNFFKLPFKKQ